VRLHRLIAILLLLESRGIMKAADLAEALETSTRSIYRDIDVLAESGIPLRSTPGPKGGISLMEGYTVNLKQLNGEDVIQLYLTGMGIYSGGNAESGMKLRNALLKLEKTLPAAYQSDIRKAKSRFYFDEAPWWTEHAVLPCLEALRAALWRTQKITVEYSKVNGERSSRVLLPYGLVVKQADWYLIAYCELSGQIRTFKCERIISAIAIEEMYDIPEDFILERYWSRQERIFKEACREEAVYPVMLRVAKIQGTEQLLQSLEILAAAEEEDKQVLTVNMYGYDSACRESLRLMGYSESIEVIGPAEIRLFIKEKLRQLQQIYG